MRYIRLTTPVERAILTLILKNFNPSAWLRGHPLGRKPKPKAVCGPKSGCIRVLTTKT